VSRKKKHPEHVNHERWLISYADFITLLFAFFVVLYSSSQVDHRKVGKLAMAIQVAFQELGVFPASGTSVPLQAGDVPPNSIQMLENVEPTAPLGRIISSAAGVLSGPTENGDVSALQKELETALAPEISRKDVALRKEPDGLVISLREVGFFSSGSAQLRPSAIPALQRIAGILLERPYQIRIEGHTDNIRIHNAQFASNWELSTARAIEVVRLLISGMGFAPERLSIGGYGEFHPVASNTTEEGRALNRRVDVVILRRSIVAAAIAAAAIVHTSVVPGRPVVVATQETAPPRTAAGPRHVGANAKPSPAHLVQR
jgi:chemotaxis protein MotB